jgi:hypothetical protein
MLRLSDMLGGLSVEALETLAEEATEVSTPMTVQVGYPLKHVGIMINMLMPIN